MRKAESAVKDLLLLISSPTPYAVAHQDPK